MGRKKKNNVVRAYKHLLERDYDWDFSFLLFLERKKMKRMAAYFSKAKITVDDPLTARDLNICLRLLDITLDEEKATIAWNDAVFDVMKMRFFKSPGEDLYTLKHEYKGQIPDFPKYVNLRNWKRFLPDCADFRNNDEENPIEKKWREEDFKERVRKAKAWHLYNLIREYKMFSWWD